MRAVALAFVSCLALGMMACGVAPSPAGQSVYVGGSGPTGIAPSAVVIGKSDPPPGSRDLGAIEGVSGSGCGYWGAKGNFHTSMEWLRHNAAMRGANYVMMISTTEPYLEAGCYKNEFKILGIAYYTPPASARPPAPPSADACDPPCSPGYRCERQVCLAVCNPACGPGSICRQDRTCGPAPAPTSVPPAPGAASKTPSTLSPAPPPPPPPPPAR